MSKGKWSPEARERAAQRAAEKASVKAEMPMREPRSEPEPESNEIYRVTPRNPRREALLKELDAARGETDVPRETEEAPVETPKEEVVTEEPKQEPKQEITEEAPQKTPPEQPKTQRVKIDGDEFDVPQEEIDKYGSVYAYQINKASEKRLHQINEMLSQAKRVFEQKPPVTEPSVDEVIASKIDTIRWGTPEESAVALKEVLQKMSQPPINPEQLLAHATDRFRHDHAVTEFDKEFQDIGTSPMHLELVVALRNKSLQLKGHPGDWNKFYRDIGNQVRSIMPKPTTVPAVSKTTEPTSQASDKEARKASIVALPTATARAELPKEQKEPTKAEILNEMRKARGFRTD